MLLGQDSKLLVYVDVFARPLGMNSDFGPREMRDGYDSTRCAFLECMYSLLSIPDMSFPKDRRSSH